MQNDCPNGKNDGFAAITPVPGACKLSNEESKSDPTNVNSSAKSSTEPITTNQLQLNIKAAKCLSAAKREIKKHCKMFPI